MLQVDSAQRLRRAYASRDANNTAAERYSFLNPAALFAAQSRERNLLHILSRYGLTAFERFKILDLGCGTGGLLRKFNQYGARVENLFGVDLLPDRIETAKLRSPGINFRCADAQHLAFDDESFDLVSHVLLFSTILEDQVRKSVAREMVRLVKRSGAIIWFDCRVNNPRNPDIRRIGRREIESLFAGCTIELHATGLAPPLTRTLSLYAWPLAAALEKIPLFCTHYIGLIQRPIPSP
jgi:ubiquinone/menaquinone biosynthesis C-methylase UbiE